MNIAFLSRRPQLASLLPLVTAAVAGLVAACGDGTTHGLGEEFADPGALIAAGGSGAPSCTDGREFRCADGGAATPPPNATADAGSGGNGEPVDASSHPSPDAGAPACVPTFSFGGTSWGDNLSNEAQAASQMMPTVHGPACMDCHTTPALPTMPKFEFGGRVVDEDGNPIKLAEVRVANTTTGAPVSAYSNADGYFWFPPPSSSGYHPGGGDTTQFPSAVGVRTPQDKVAIMCAEAANGNCNGCHTAAVPIVVKTR